MAPLPTCINTRFVKNEDLNHHGTLFAGRTAEWFVESGFIAAASVCSPKHIVCLKVHGLYFSKPVLPGTILTFTSTIVYTGKTSLIAYIKVTTQDNASIVVDGFITFIHVDEQTKAVPHGIVVVPTTPEEQALFTQAERLALHR